jgi:murein L,D-transpeptidase YafK
MKKAVLLRLLVAFGFISISGHVPVATADAARSALKADKILVLKGERQLFLVRDGTVMRSYLIALGSEPQGPKVMEGDGKTPEGLYVIDGRNPDSAFYRSLHISYPNDQDIARADALGVPPGDKIVIHGLPMYYGLLGKRHAASDWTDGCIAVSNSEMDEIWYLVDDGTPIEIRP